MLDLHLDGCIVQSIEVRRLCFHDFVPAQRQGLGHRHTVLIGADGVHQIAGAVVVDLEYGAGDRGAGGPAVHAVVVGAGLGHLDLPCDGGILPFNLRHLARLDIDGALLGVRDISLILQLPQVEAARGGQVLKPSIAPVVRGLLVNGVMAAAIQDERHAGDALSVRGGNFMEQDAGEGCVSHGLAGGLPIFYSKVNGRIVQFEALCALGFQCVVIAILQREIGPAIPPGGHSVHQSVVRYPPYLKGHAGKPLRLVR